MSIIRTEHNKENPYVMLNKRVLEDPNLSWAAKGLWSYLMSRPDDWIVSVAHLSTIYNEKGGGEKAIYSLLRELEKFGYCHKQQIRVEKGQFAKYEYVITEMIKKISPLASERDAVEPRAVKVGTNNERVIKKKEDIYKDDIRLTSEEPIEQEDFVNRDSSSDIKSDSFSSEEKQLSDQIDRLGHLEFRDGTPIKPQTVMVWLRKFSFEDIESALKYYFRMVKLGQTKIKKHEAYVETILRERYWIQKEKKDYVKQQCQDHEKRKLADKEFWGKK